MNALQRVALALVIIGAINWGLIGLFQFDLVASIFGGQDAALSRVIYTLVGIGALCCLPLLFAPTADEESSAVERNRNLQYSTEIAEETDPSKFNNEKEK
ncbi:DUF378 domain-containing protein [Gracilibacillus caseinilyticus]|uniref:DUF378 domain-containing protein n=1 Tax=Gracilibacillus caseinilyticus TaxID=2932256 RepID=A0ABY4ERA8_9BACI|nr:DUF378 domain-containing protein [Gracilibacillus caseinilyticus]UOQ46956.1 DUF378 domain-containing protein [Gracilibacillus caseinilyticus]